MKRYVDISEISDGRLYGCNDMVKVSCGNCEGCSECCKKVGKTIILDPLDITNIKEATGLYFEGLLNNYIELNAVDGLVLPNISTRNGDGCGFLDENKRCSIHKSRPGICRLYPLGRYYVDGDYKYILQTNECVKPNHTKVKISKWLGIDNLKEYHDFILAWHNFTGRLEKIIMLNENSEENSKLNMLILKYFYINNLGQGQEFYHNFYKALDIFEGVLREIGEDFNEG